MLSYIHAYHAGNHADILKHLTLSLILGHLTRKDKPLTVIDTHAGSGVYSLRDERAIKTGEADSGIGRVAAADKNLLDGIRRVSDAADKYLSLVTDCLARGEYPGSPLIESAFLRPGDEHILSELHPAASEELRECFRRRGAECAAGGGAFVRPQIHRRDGYEMLAALTPPRIRRGLCVIDPSFEDTDDFARCAGTITEVMRKWSAGTVVLWYPLIERRSAEISAMRGQIAAAARAAEPKVLDIQLEVRRREEMTGLASLYGSGMLIVNFPYRLDAQMREIMPHLSRILGQTADRWSVGSSMPSC